MDDPTYGMLAISRVSTARWSVVMPVHVENAPSVSTDAFDHKSSPKLVRLWNHRHSFD